jgi:hypothetical protein
VLHVPKTRFAAALLATLASDRDAANQLIELFSNPQVAAVMTDLDKHLDPAKLKALTDEAASP